MTDTERMDAPTKMSVETQRRQWHEEDLQRQTKALCRVQRRMSVVSFLAQLVLLLLIGAALWFFTSSKVANLEQGLVAEQVKLEAADRRVTELVGTLVGVDRFDALGIRVRDSEDAIRAISGTLSEMRKYLEQVDRSVGLVNTTVGTLARDLDRDRDVREKMLVVMDKLSERLDEQPIR